jgi:hypothetical protein
LQDILNKILRIATSNSTAAIDSACEDTDLAYLLQTTTSNAKVIARFCTKTANALARWRQPTSTELRPSPSNAALDSQSCRPLSTPAFLNLLYQGTISLLSMVSYNTLSYLASRNRRTNSSSSSGSELDCKSMKFFCNTIVTEKPFMVSLSL